MKSRDDPDLTSVVTAVLWVVTAIVGASDRFLLASPNNTAKPEMHPVEMRMMNVDVSDAPALPTETVASQSRSTDEPSRVPETAPVIPEVQEPAAMKKVTEQLSAQTLKPATRPTARQTAVVDSAAVSSKPVIHHLVYGTGEGQQPAPEYPREAQLARQQGTVVIQFQVNDDGTVSDVRIGTPSPWPLLNQAALRAVRDRWRFSTGLSQIYDVPIQFQLRKQ